MTSSLTKFDTGHEDLIHDVAYDFYGKRLVTCSSDQKLKVWDFVEREDCSVWELSDSWKAHDSSILKAIWARPEYGQVIASCSFDRQVKIWEEQPTEPRNSQKRWVERFRLVESRGAVLDISFAPTPNSLRLATCSSDGIVRIYEALEPTNLAQWSQMEEFEISSSIPNTPPAGQQSQGQQALPQQQPQGQIQQQLQQTSPYQSQLQQQFQQLQQHQSQLQQQLQQYQPQSQHPQQPVNTKSTSSSGSSIKSHGLSTPGVPDVPTMTSTTAGYIQGISPSSTAGIGEQTNAGSIHRPIDADSGYCIDWCPNRLNTAMMVAGLGKEKGARIFKHDGHNRWIPGEILPGHTQEVHDVSWAPNLARSYQLIATASKDQHVRIYKITESTQQAQQQRGSSSNRMPISPAGTPTQQQLNKPLNVELIASFPDHKAEVWRVEWNVTGTILSSSGDDGKLRLWTAGYDGKWRQMATVTANQQVPPST
ncbi:Putative SEH1 protein [Rhizopus microsporus]|nr:Putative SEH1 protein [Rhizopus microsporus]